MPSTHRFSILATLPDEGGLRRALAVERSGAARPVVLLFAASGPADVVAQAAALSALSRDAEAAARLHHPSVVPVAGLEPVGEALAVVELFRLGVSLRDLLDAGGRLPPAIAVRIAVDACAGLGAVHALDPGDGRPFAHGALAPERILVQDDGRAAIAGLAAAAAAGAPSASESGPAADLRALAAALHEALAGESPASSDTPLAAPGVPPPLAAVVDRALGRSALAPFASAAELASALDAAVAPAAREAVAAYAEAVAPREEGTRGALARLVAAALPPPIPPRDDTAEVTAELLPPETAMPASGAATPITGALAAAPVSNSVEPTPVATPVNVPAPVPVPAKLSSAGPDSVATFPRPEPRPARSLAPVAAAAVFGAAGLVLGLLLARGTPTDASGHPERSSAASAAERSRRAAAATPTAPSTDDSGHPERSSAASAAERSRRAATPVPASTRRAGDRAGTAAAAAPKPRPAPTRKTSAAPKVTARPEGSGVLSVTAPLEAEVFLDGKRIGTGILRTEIPAGDHRVEVRLGGARVGERFSVAPGETWTYVVNPE